MIHLIIKRGKIQNAQNAPAQQDRNNSSFWIVIVIALCWTTSIWAPTFHVVGRSFDYMSMSS